MQLILKTPGDQPLQEDSWELYQGEAIATLPAQGSWLWPLSVWLEHQDELRSRQGQGLWLDADADPAQLRQLDLSQVILVGIQFEQFADGRGFSTAVLLRQQLGYQGELRAFGDVLPDFLDSLVRCGFDSFALRAAEELEAARCSLALMDYYYQGSTIEPKPLFRRVDRST